MTFTATDIDVIPIHTNIKFKQYDIYSQEVFFYNPRQSMTLEEYAERLKSKIAKLAMSDTMQTIESSTADLPNWEDYPEWHLEIGCGAGLHPILHAKANPEVGLVALERTVEKFSKFKNRHDQHQLKNLYPLHHDGLNWLAKTKIQNHFQKLFLLYPNPYPKNTQRNKRFMGIATFSHALNSLKSGGQITMRSNERDYLDESLYLAKEVWKLDLISDKEVEGIGITHFERKYLERGLSCFELIWQKN